MTYWIVRFLTLCFSKIFFPFQVHGVENILPRGAFIYASNHISYLDPVVLAISCQRRISFVAKDSLFKNKLFGWFISNLDAFPIKRESADIGAIRETIKRLKQGRAVLIFPQGTRIHDPDFRKVESGIGMITVKSGVPVVPVYVTGTDRALPEGAKFFKRYPITIYIGKAVSYSPQDPYSDIASDIMNKILSLPQMYQSVSS